MIQPLTSDECLNAFGDAVVANDWEALCTLLSPEHFPSSSATDLSKVFSWERLEPMLKVDWSAQTGEPNDPDNPLAPPITHRHYPVSQVAAARCELLDEKARPRYPVIDATKFDEWHEIVFEPAPDSGFDVSFQCEVAVIDVGVSKRVAAFVIGNVLD